MDTKAIVMAILWASDEISNIIWEASGNGTSQPTSLRNVEKNADEIIQKAKSKENQDG